MKSTADLSKNYNSLARNPSAFDIRRSSVHKDRDQQENHSSKPSYMKWLAVVLGLALAASLSFNLYYMQNNKALKQRRDTEIIRMDSLLSVKLLVDKELDEAKEALNYYQSENDSINSILLAANVELEQQRIAIDSLFRERADVELLHQKLSEARAFNKKIQHRMQVLITENGQLKSEVQVLKKDISSLETVKKELENKLDDSAVLQAHSIQMTPMNKNWRGQYVLTDKAKKADLLEIRIDIARNKLSPAGERAIYVTVTGPDGRILTDTEAKTFTNESGNIGPYTWAHKFIYKQTGETFAFNWEPKRSFATGDYTTEVFCDGRLIGKSQLSLK